LNADGPLGSAASDPPGLVVERWAELPLFPLQAVLFPGGLLQLKVFEARYLDLITGCLRSSLPFGVVCIHQGSEQRGSTDKPRLESIAVLAHLQEVDAEQAGILQVSCLGGARVLLGSPRQRADGLWLSDAQAGPRDCPAPVPPELVASARALGQAIVSLAAQGQHPFNLPHRLDDAGWVANRWCEILPISTAAKYRLMALDEPQLRLKLVDEYLRGKGVF
jgi:Lon protease-like protein